MIRPRAAHLLAVALILPSLVVSIAGCPFSAETFHRNCTVVADCNDDNPCTDDKCTAGICENPNKAKEAACPSGVCDGSGKCVECLSNADCMAQSPEKPVCDTSDDTCVSCDDGKKNGKETGVDCGGPDCGACPGQPCDPTKGCGQQGACSTKDGICCDKACDGTCESCAMAKTGMPDGTCASIPEGGMDPSGTCTMKGGCGAAPGKCRCEDGTKNGDETDVDCGGPTCATGCGGGKACMSGTDCAVEVPGNTPACIAGACCESLCNQPCHSCNSMGQCAPAPGANPIYPATNMPSCPGQLVCGAGSSGCVKTAGVACTMDAECLSGNCPPLVNKCAQSAMGQPCATNMDCATGTTCKSNICSP